MTESLEIILATHNNLELTIQAVKCLYAHTVNPFKLIVVDDSDDLTVEWITKYQIEYSNITLIHSDIPYTHGNQIIQMGLEQTKGEIVGYLGNSTRVEPEWDVVALETMKAHQEIGLVGFKLLYDSGVIEHAGMYWTPDMPHHMNFGVNQPGRRYSFLREVPAVGWALVLMRKLALPEKLDITTYHGFRGYDDMDNCLEMAKRGWKILYCGLGAAYHQAGATRHSNDEQYFKEHEENRITFLKRWGGTEKALASSVVTQIFA